MRLPAARRPPRSPTCGAAACARCCARAGRRSSARCLGARVVDELFLTISPLIAGNPEAPRIVEGETLDAPLTLELAWVLRHDDELYLRYRIDYDG